MFRAAIFDLDNCLAASDEPGRDLFEPAFEAIRNANKGTLDEQKLGAAFEELWRTPFTQVAEKFGFNKAMIDAGNKAFSQTEVRTPMHGYDDLHLLQQIPLLKFLVTSGFRRLQESKIRALNFRHYFDAVYVDAVDEPNHRGKHGVFREIMATHRLKPEETLIIGDNPISEIEAGNKLHAVTVQILRPKVPKGDNAQHHVSDLHQLFRLISRENGMP